MATLTLKNYRCYSDAHPARLPIMPGFSALVGPNNTGKSTILRCIFELRQLWTQFAPSGHLIDALRGNPFNIPAIGLHDDTEIYCNRNTRDMILQVDLERPLDEDHGRPLTQFQIRSSRTNTGRWNVVLPSGDNVPSIPAGAQLELHNNAIRVAGVNGWVADTRALIKFMSTLAGSMYIGPYSGTAEYFDINIGVSFVETWNTWKNGNSKEQNRRISAVEEDLRRIFRFSSLSINADAAKRSLNVVIDREPYKLGELGAGLSQFIIVFAAAAIRKPTLILIDEPELHLHPSLQLDFLTSLGAYSTDGVMFATHSLGLARSAAEQILSTRRENDEIILQDLRQNPRYSEFLGEMSFSSFRELGADVVLFVEGVNEIKTMQQFLRMHQIDHKIVMLPLGGSAMINGEREQELSEVLRITQNVWALIDSEQSQKDEPLSASREAFAKTCAKLKINLHITKRRAIENYLPEARIREEMGPSYRELQHFELLKDAKPAWGKADSWRIARRMTKTDLDATDVGEFLSSLAASLKR